MTIFESNAQLVLALSQIYDQRESAAIANLVMENITGWGKIDRIIHKQTYLSLSAIALLEKYTSELMKYKPVQYVLGEAWFLGMKLYVNEGVLVPRPETEELVEWLLQEVKGSMEHPWHKFLTPSQENTELGNLTVLDVGTGSGCISIALKKKLPAASIYAIDISQAALLVAERNASSHHTEIHFQCMDFLNFNESVALPNVDILISNPPYIPSSDKTFMQPNVIDFEPHLALFVENQNPLIFYEAIANFAKLKLKKGGAVFVETHEDLSSSVKKLFSFHGFSSIEIKKDMQGKERMIKATLLL